VSTSTSYSAVLVVLLSLAVVAAAFAAPPEDALPGRAGSAAMPAATEPSFVPQIDWTTVRDKLWLFGMPVKQFQCKCGDYEGRPMTTFEAACHFGIYNVLFVVQDDVPEPPFDDYAKPLMPLKRVVWSILGDSRCTRNDLDAVLDLSTRFPNVTGGIMDDFFKKREDRVARFSLEEVEHMRERLRSGPRKLDLWVVIYEHQLDLPVGDYLASCDAITFWHWWADKLPKLEENFARLEALAPDTPKLLGCYFTDYGGGKPMPVELMKHQCELGLKWLHEGRIEGMIFLGNPHCGLGMASVEWTRRWIAKVGDVPVWLALPPAPR
jgi:hypothetical protein